MPLWAWPRVRLLMYYMGDLDLWLLHLPALPQIEDLTKIIVSVIKKVLPTLAPTPMDDLPDPIYSI